MMMTMIIIIIAIIIIIIIIIIILTIIIIRVDEDYQQHLEMIESVKELTERRRNEQSNVLKQKKLHG